ncbi:MAG: glycosyltransferase, partial [Pyrinomonadaceae bacterium]|nr:glycosyltransferase [Pyrinomonadaceae bacterium]
MRILKITQTYYPYLDKGGPPVKVRGIARALVERGHEVTVLTADFGEPARVTDTPEAQRRRTVWGWESSRDGVEAIYLLSLANYRAATINPHVLNFCTSRLRSYDVIHIYGLYDALGAVTAWFCRRSGIPYVIEPLGMFGPKIRSQHKKRVYDRLIGGGLFHGAEAIVATSETEQSELVAGGIDREKIVLRRNGLDLGEFQNLPSKGAFRARLSMRERQPLVLFLGRLSFIKGLDLLVEAFAQINREARLVIAGPDDGDGCLERIRRSIADLKIEERVILPGPLFGKEKLEALVDADLFVLPSRHESFGNAAAEAIACGTPVLITSGCGIAPLVDGRAGSVVACEVEALRDGLARLLEDETLLTQLKEGCGDLSRTLSWDEPVA